MLVAASVVSARARTDRPTPPFEQRYFVVDGADYRTVGRTAFASFRSTCTNVETKRYLAERVEVVLCTI